MSDRQTNMEDAKIENGVVYVRLRGCLRFEPSARFYDPNCLNRDWRLTGETEAVAGRVLRELSRDERDAGVHVRRSKWLPEPGAWRVPSIPQKITPPSQPIFPRQSLPRPSV